MAGPRFEVVEESSAAFVARRFGEEARAWLAALPSLLDDLAARWGLELGTELRGGLLSCVRAAVGAGGEPLVLKVAGPWSRTADEISVLRAWAGRCAPRLVRSDATRGALLLERIEPGERALDASAETVAPVLRQLHLALSAGDGSLPPLAAIADDRVRSALEDGRTDERRAAGALATVAALGADAPAPVLLHGDFDDRNLLVCKRRGLAAIDPLPCGGDPAYDAAYWAHANRRPGVRDRQAAIAAALDVDLERVRAWGNVIATHG